MQKTVLYKSNFSSLLREKSLREEKDYSIIGLSRTLKVSRQVIREWLDADKARGVLKTDVIEKLSDWLGCQWHELIVRVEE